MRELAEVESGQVSLGVRDRFSVVSIESIPGPHRSMVMPDLWPVWPLLHSAMGRAHLAALAPADRDTLLADFTRSLDNPLLHRRAAQRFGGREEPRAEENAIGPENEGGGKSAALGNAACGKDRGGRNRINDGWQQLEERAAGRSVPAGLGALCHDHVRPERLGLPGFGKRSDLQDEPTAGSVDFGNEPRRIAKG